MRNSLKMDVLDELRLFREKRLSNSTFCTLVSYSNLNMNLNLNLKLESETVERIVKVINIGVRGGGQPRSQGLSRHGNEVAGGGGGCSLLLGRWRPTLGSQSRYVSRLLCDWDNFLLKLHISTYLIHT